ncbi:hypothetical protein ACI65C_004309 [Semiaphis heraclei]
MSENKRKGGAQKVREKNKKLLTSQANLCRPITELFSIPLTQKSDKCTTPSNITISNAVNDCTSNNTFLNSVNVSNEILCNGPNSDEAVNCKYVDNTLNTLEKENAMQICALVNADVEDEVIMVEDVDKNNLLDNNFKKPMPSGINDFFKFHPKQPDTEKLFKSSKAYFRSSSIKRQWLSFDDQSKSLFCSVCLAFSSEPNLFTKGLSIWAHVYQRIEEHEASKTHMSCSESYLLHTNTIQTSPDFNPEIKAKAKNLKETFMSYELILTAFIYIKIFKIVGPLSRYLQTTGIDLIKSQELVNKALNNLKEIQRGMKYVKSEADKFITIIEETFEDKHNMDILIEKEFPKIRCRYKKKMADEITSDQPILNAEEKFTVEVHNIIFDKTISCMEERFSSNKKLYCDLACLSPNNFKDLHDKELPSDTLLKLSEVLKKFDDKLTHAKLLDELLNFSSTWNQLKKTVPEYYENSSEDDIEEETNDKHGTNVEKVHCKSCMNCPHCCYNVLLKYNLYTQLKNSDEYDELDDALVRISNACGHICYLQKTILIYGFTEVRQTHALRGVNIARDQIMVISSEKPRKTDDVQSYLTPRRVGGEITGGTAASRTVFSSPTGPLNVEMNRLKMKRPTRQKFLVKEVRNRPISFEEDHLFSSRPRICTRSSRHILLSTTLHMYNQNSSMPTAPPVEYIEASGCCYLQPQFTMQQQPQQFGFGFQHPPQMMMPAQLQQQPPLQYAMQPLLCLLQPLPLQPQPRLHKIKNICTFNSLINLCFRATITNNSKAPKAETEKNGPPLQNTVLNYVRKSQRQSWSLISMNKAVDEVIDKTMTYREAQDAYEVPRSTLLRMPSCPNTIQMKVSDGTVFENVSPKDVMPIPQRSNEENSIPKRKSLNRGKTVVLTSSPYKNELETKQKMSEPEVKRKLFKKKSNKSTTNKNKKKRVKLSTNNDDDIYTECLYCGHTYAESNEGWICCQICEKWAHLSCSGKDNEENTSFICENCL